MTRDDQVALVTGACGGLGSAMTLALLQSGKRVILTSASPMTLAAAMAKLGVPDDRAFAVPADLGNVQDRNNLINAAKERFGRIDVLINNAGIIPDHIWPDSTIHGAPLPWTIGTELYTRFLEVNVVAAHDLSAAFIPEMIERGWGRIINITTSLDTMLNLWPYGSTKAALEAYTAVIAKELEGTGVTANVLIPGGLTRAEPFRDKEGRIIRTVIHPDVMGAPAAWLASEGSGGFNGRRLTAVLWDQSASGADAAIKASAPVGWRGQGQVVPQ